MHDIAQHICDFGRDIDSALDSGSLEIVDRIAEVEVQGKKRHFYSFAAKYCSWHRQDYYPIYDSFVDIYLWRLQKRDHFAPFFSANADLWTYPSFHRVVLAFRDHYGLGSFTFKQIDKFLWMAENRLAEASRNRKRV